MRPRLAFAFAGCILATLLAAPTASAWVFGWRSAIAPNLNTAISQAGADDYLDPAVCTDGRGGMWVAYHQSGFSNGVGIARERADGTTGFILNSTIATTQDQVSVAPGDSGGVIVAWRDSRNSAVSGNDIYAQYFGPDGLRRWGASGVQITNAAGDQWAPVALRSSSGFTIAWMDDRNGAANTDLYAARINTSGVLLTPLGGNAIVTHASDQLEPVFALTGDGLVAAWVDTRNGNADVFVEKINSFGLADWGTGNGVTVCAAAGAQGTPSICSDGDLGVLVFWDDARGADLDIYGQRIAQSGLAQWTANGVLVSGATANQLDPIAASDGQGGAVVAWLDDRAAPRELFAQRVLSYGTPFWTANGVNVASAAMAAPTDHRVLADGLGGAYVVWTETRVGQADLFGQRLSSGGAVQWTTSGVTISSAGGTQVDAALQLADDNGLLAVWQDTRNGPTDVDIMAQRVDRYGFLGDASPDLVDVSDIPGDQGGRVRLDWRAGYVEFDPYLQVANYYVLREVPAALATSSLRAGARLTSEPTTPAPGERLIFAPPFAAQTTYWEYVGQVPAFQSDTYSFVAPTTSDSVPGVPASTQFMVLARNSTGSRYWFSDVLVGQSYDNLAPQAPALFTGLYAAGSTRLAWNPNRESDFATYRIYRGTSVGFTPGPENLVASPPDTGYVDVAGAPFVYKLTAVDVHQNESAVATVVPSGTVGAEVLSPSSLELAAPSPNPATHSTSLRFTLPRAARAQLAVQDVSGREVRVLADGPRSAGAYTTNWDLCDRDGRAVPPGLYFARLRTAEGTVVRRVLVRR